MSILITVCLGFVASFFGGMLGIGGGIFIVPALTLILNIPVQIAIASSLITIIANACTASIIYMKAHTTNIKICLLFATATLPGAIVGSFLADILSSELLITLFSVIVLIMAFFLLFQIKLFQKTDQHIISATENKPDTWQFIFYDNNSKKYIPYEAKRLPLGSGISFLGGIISNMLGIGGGFIYVPVMRLLLGMPIKTAISSSAFIISITTASGALIHYHNEYLQPALIAPLILGAVLGSGLGSITALRMKSEILQIILFIFMIFIAILMFLRAIGIM